MLKRTSHRAVPTLAPPTSRKEEINPPVAAAATQHSQVIAELKTLAQAKKRGLFISVNVFGPAGVDPTFARIYELAPGEVAALNEAVKAAKDKFNAIAIQSAKAQLSGDGSSLVVEVPPVVDQGGVIYDQLLQTFERMLGPDRYQSFNALSGDSFDQGFGSFGLWSSRYELTPTTQTVAKGVPIYRVVVASNGPNGSSTSNNAIPLKMISTQFPVLNHFIPPGFDSAPGGK